MKLSQLNDAVAVADKGSVRAAARHLGKAQPALMRSLRELEHELGMKLFDRRATAVRMTLLGERLVQRARGLQREIERTREELEQLRGTDQGSVSVGLSMASHLGLLPSVLPPFTKRYPDIRLDLVEGLFPNLRSGLLEGRIDLYVGPLGEEPLDGRFTAEMLLSNKRLVFGCRDHPLRHARHLSELAGARWVTTTITASHGAELTPIFQAHRLPAPQVTLTAASTLSTALAIGHSQLLGMLPSQWRDSVFTEHLLTEFPIEEEMEGLAILLVHNAAMAPTPAAEFFGDLVRRVALRQKGNAASLPKM